MLELISRQALLNKLQELAGETRGAMEVGVRVAICVVEDASTVLEMGIDLAHQAPEEDEDEEKVRLEYNE